MAKTKKPKLTADQQKNRRIVSQVANAIGLPTGNTKTILAELTTAERERVVSACDLENYDLAHRKILSVISGHRARKQKPKVKKGPKKSTPDSAPDSTAYTWARIARRPSDNYVIAEPRRLACHRQVLVNSKTGQT